MGRAAVKTTAWGWGYYGNNEYSSRLGEPRPALFTTPEVALVVMALETVAGAAVGCACRYRAATPATWGVAMEVPLMVLLALLLPIQAEVMLEPGANTSRQEP